MIKYPDGLLLVVVVVVVVVVGGALCDTRAREGHVRIGEQVAAFLPASSMCQ